MGLINNIKELFTSKKTLSTHLIPGSIWKRPSDEYMGQEEAVVMIIDVKDGDRRGWLNLRVMDMKNNDIDYLIIEEASFIQQCKHIC